MSNYYYRDNEGNWFVKQGKEPLDFSPSMEIAYQMGKIATLNEMKERLDALQIRIAQVDSMDNTPIQGE